MSILERPAHGAKRWCVGFGLRSRHGFPVVELVTGPS